MNISKSLSEIVQIPSISGHERNLADHLFTSLLVSGLKPTKQDGNIVVHIKGKDSSKAVIFNAHMDTVSSGALSLWKYPPYGKGAGIEHAGKVYGLGASDAKGSLAALLALGEEYAKTAPAMDVWITFVCKEETGGDGTKSFLAWFTEKGWIEKYTELSVVIAGPTNMDEIRIGHRGNMHAEITVRGQGGHGSEPHLIKQHAILDTMKMIEALKKLEKDWEKKFSDPVIGEPSIGITSIQAGDPTAPNKFPDTCSFTIDIRTTPALHKKAYGLIESLCEKFDAQVRTVYTPSPPGHTAPTAAIVVAAQKLVGTVGLAKDSTDLCFFSEVGIPGIILGPGDHEISHKPNEYCEIKKIDKAVTVYKKLVSSL